VTRTLLTLFIAALTLGTGLYAALVQSSNYERARQLAELQRSWENLEAINVQREARAAAHLVGSDDGARPDSVPFEGGYGEVAQ